MTDVVKDLKGRFALRRVVFVGDRGMLSDLNLEGLIDEQLGFIVAHPLRRNLHAREVIGSLGRKFDRDSMKEQILEEKRQALRFVVAYSPRSPGRSRPGGRLAEKADAWIEDQLQNSSSPERGGVRRLLKGCTTGSAITCATGTCSVFTTSLWPMGASKSRKTGRRCCGNRRSTGC